MQSIIHAIVGGSINPAIENGHIRYIHHITLVSNIISILHLLTSQIENNYAKAAGNVGKVSIEKDTVDAFVAHDIFFLDVAHVTDVALAVDEVDIGVGIGHKELALTLAIAHRANANIRQSIDFIENTNRIVILVVIKQLVFRGRINQVSNGFHGNDFMIGQMGAPIADGDFVLSESTRREETW